MDTLHRFILLFVFIFCVQITLLSQVSLIEGEWSGVTNTEDGLRYIHLNLAQVGDKLIGEMYDSTYADHTFCQAVVEAQVLSKNRFLVEGKHIIRSQGTDNKMRGMSIVYFDFRSQDTIIAKIAEEGNYTALLGSNNGNQSTFVMARKRRSAYGRMPATPAAEEDVALEMPLEYESMPLPPVIEDNTELKKTITPSKIATKELQMFTLIIEDSDQEDGDVIRIKFNGHTIVDILVVTLKPFLTPLYFDPTDNNTLEIISLSEGRIVPTTVKITLLQGKRLYERKLVGIKKGESFQYTF